VEGAELTIMYPADIGANPRNLNGYSPTDWHPLLKEAYLRPAELLARLIQEGHDISQRPLPPSRRGARIRELQAETADLAFIEEEALRQALARGESVTRSLDAPPEAILGHKIVEPPRVKDAKEQPHAQAQAAQTAAA